MALHDARAIAVPGRSHNRQPRWWRWSRPRRSSWARRFAVLAALLALWRCEWGGQPGLRGLASVPSAADGGFEQGDEEDHGGHHGGHHEEHLEHHEPSFSLDVDHLASHPWLFFGEIVTVVVLSLLFETWEHWVHHRIEASGDKTAEKILTAVFKEFTCLGFIGLTLFGATRCGLMGFCANSVRDTDDHILLETFETVHMIIFLLLIVLIFQAVAMLHVAHNVIADWSTFEHMRAFGNHRNSLESAFVDGGYLQRVANPKAPRQLDLACKRMFTYGGETFLQRLSRRHDYIHSLVMWRCIRHEFLFPTRGTPSAVPTPALFSYSAYLRSCMTEVVMSLVELDKRVWCLTLLLPGPAAYYADSMNYSSWQALLCFFAWSLICGALLLTVALEEDLHGLMPAHSLPEDPRQILCFFQGTSSPEMLQDIKDDDEDLNTAAVKRGAPGFRSMRIFTPTVQQSKEFLLPSGVCKELMRVLGFWQAICITALVTSCACRMPHKWTEIAVCLLTFAEWPLMLFWVVPVLIRRFTVRVSNTVDEDKIRTITLDCKQALLRHHLRLVQFEGFYVRAAKLGEAWALEKGDARSRSWSVADASRRFKQGHHTFQGLPHSAQDEIGTLFAILDVSNDGSVSTDELSDFFMSMGFKEKATIAAESLVRLVDKDGTGELSEEGFQAALALATVARPEREIQEDLETFFDMIDKENSGKVYCYQITQSLQETKMGADLSEDDVASLLYDHFSLSKPSLGKDEFVAWFEAMGTDRQKKGHVHGHGHGHGHHGGGHSNSH